MSFEGGGLEGGSFEGKSLEGGSFEGRSLEGGSFEGGIFGGRSLEGGSLEGGSFEGRSLEGGSSSKYQGDCFEFGNGRSVSLPHLPGGRIWRPKFVRKPNFDFEFSPKHKLERVRDCRP